MSDETVYLFRPLPEEFRGDAGDAAADLYTSNTITPAVRQTLRTCLDRAWAEVIVHLRGDEEARLARAEMDAARLAVGLDPLPEGPPAPYVWLAVVKHLRDLGSRKPETDVYLYRDEAEARRRIAERWPDAFPWPEFPEDDLSTPTVWSTDDGEEFIELELRLGLDGFPR